MYTVKAIDEMESRHHGAWKLAAAELGVESFGMQVLDFPAGFSAYPEHDHADDGMEEVYVVLGGSASFDVDGDRVEMAPGRMLRIEPAARRKLITGANGVRILAIGCTIGTPYERHSDFSLGAGS